MGFIAKTSGDGGNFKRVPQGVYIGRCYSLIDIGTQITTGKHGTSAARKIKISWELFGDDADGKPLTIQIDGKDMPMVISKNYTISLHEKASLRHDLAAWRGKDFTEDECRGFDVSKLLGAFCMVNVTQSETNGKIYSNVAGLTPLPGALKTSKPEPVHANIIFDLDAPNMDVFAGFYDKLKQVIQASPEWAISQKKTSKSVDAGPSGFDDFEDSIPF